MSLLIGARRTLLRSPAVAGATFDPANKGANISLSNGNLTATGSVAFASVLSTTSKTTGKHYYEFLLTTVGTASSNLLGFAKNDQNVNSYLTIAGNAAITRGVNGSPVGSGIFTVNSANEPTFTATDGSILGIAIDLTAGKAWCSHNNTFGGDPGAGTNPFVTWTADASAIFIGHSTVNSVTTLRTTAAQQSYSPPSGFTAWG